MKWDEIQDGLGLDRGFPPGFFFIQAGRVLARYPVLFDYESDDDDGLCKNEGMIMSNHLFAMLALLSKHMR